MRIKITRTNGEKMFTEVKNYNPEEIMKKMEDDKKQLIQIGDIIIQKRNISIIAPDNSDEEQSNSNKKQISDLRNKDKPVK